MNAILEDKIKLLPTDPGVYVMLNSDKQIIYVGKAKNLKNRVKQYFYTNVKTEKVAAMVSNIADFYYIITISEIDALSLENNLIKKHKPRYNILLKDDKTYPYIKVNLGERYPCFRITRKFLHDKARYFGPFMGGVNAKDTLEIINQAFMLRPCQITIDKEKLKKPCLNYHIKKCAAPCAGLISEEEYGTHVNEAIDFLNGNDENVENILKDKMNRFAELEEFEIAVNYREKLKMLDKIKLKRITSLNKFVNADIIAVASNGIYGAINILVTRSGRMQGGKSYSLGETVNDNREKLYGFILQYYQNTVELPDEIIISEECDDAELLERYFKEKNGKTVNILVPKQGIRRQLAVMAKHNAEDFLEKSINKIQHKDDMTVIACERLKEILNLKKYPKRMECYDISHISGVDKVGSMVVFNDGEEDRDSYRRFRIKTVEGSDDFACLQEVLERRLNKLSSEDAERFPKPDLIIIDGGKGQLSSVKEVFDKYNTDIDLISLAKREEEIFTVGSKEPVVLNHSDYVLRMLQRIRDEAHRFAITYHRETHNKRNIYSVLNDIEGIGKVKIKALIEHFGSVENIRRATFGELTKVDGIGETHAKKIKEYFENGEQ